MNFVHQTVLQVFSYKKQTLQTQVKSLEYRSSTVELKFMRHVFNGMARLCHILRRLDVGYAQTKALLSKLYIHILFIHSPPYKVFDSIFFAFYMLLKSVKMQFIHCDSFSDKQEI